jgi:undecaprenyl-diphosphatase
MFACVVVVGWALWMQQGALDRRLFQTVNALGPHAPWFWSALSVAGLGLSAALLAGCSGPSQARALAAVLLLLVIGGLLVQGLKFARADLRPVAVLGLDAVHVIGNPLRSRAMPSGHSALAFSMAALVWVGSGWRWGLAATALAVLVGLSRMAVGAHWPSDVAAGAALGVLATLLLQRSGWAPRLGHWMRRRSAAIGTGVVLVLAAAAMLFTSTDLPDTLPLQVMLAAAGAFGGWRWLRYGWMAAPLAAA